MAKPRKCLYVASWGCSDAFRPRNCEVCLKAKQQFIALDSYTKANAHYEQTFWESVTREIERKVKQELEEK